MKQRLSLFISAVIVLFFCFNNCSRFSTTDSANDNFSEQSNQDSNTENGSMIPAPSPQQPGNQQPNPIPVTNNGPWPNEPVGLNKLIDCSFTDSTCGMWDVYNNAKYSSIGGGVTPRSPGRSLDSAMEAGNTTGGAWVGFDLPKLKEVYVATWWSTNSDFMGMCNNSNKMFFIRNPDIDNNLLIWQGAPGQPRTLKWMLQATYDNCGHPGEYGMCYTKGDGSGWFDPNGESNGTVAAGSGWHLIEVYMKASSTKTSRDGIIRWALDGKIVGNYPTVNISPGGFADFQYNHAWDGSGCLLARDLSKAWHHYWDHLYISGR